MIKRLLFSILVLSLILMGCSNEKSKEVSTKEKTEQAVQEEKAEKRTEQAVQEEKAEKKTEEEYLSEFEASAVYQNRTQNMEVSFTETVNFEGDEVPEIVLGTNDDVTQSNVTIYKLENDEWTEETTFDYHSNVAIFLDPIGKLTYDDGTLKEALAFGRTEAQASSMSQSFSILNYNEATSTIEELISVPLQSTDSLIWDLDVNTLTVTAVDGSTVHYIFKNGQIVDSNGNRMGMIIDQDLAELVGTTINNYSILLEDSYFTAQGKITEPLLEESYFEGAMCPSYETFFICDYEKEGGGLYTYYITPANHVTLNDLSSISHQTLEVVERENEIEGEYSYTTEVMTKSGIYRFQFNGNTPQSIVESLTFTPN